MNINLNEQRVLEYIGDDYESAYGMAKKCGMNWFIAFGTMCVLALEGRLEYIKLANKNYLFRKNQSGGILDD